MSYHLKPARTALVTLLPQSAADLVPKTLAVIKPAAPVALTNLDALPSTPAHSTALCDMSVEQLRGISVELFGAVTRGESVSGLCATLLGIVLIEVKKKLDHGELKPWIKQHFGKSYQTATRYRRLGEKFSKSDSTVTFEQLTLALADAAQGPEGISLDMHHPLVAAVAKWTKGRGYYQLALEELGDGRADNPGGFRPNALILRAWLAEEYPQNPEYLEQDFCDLPEEIQKRFREEGERYEQRLTKERREELEREERARHWNASVPKALHEALDEQLYVHAGPEQLQELQLALKDLLAGVNEQIRLRTEKAAKRA